MDLKLVCVSRSNYAFVRFGTRDRLPNEGNEMSDFLKSLVSELVEDFGFQVSRNRNVYVRVGQS